MTPLVLVDEPAQHVKRLTLNRPDQLNAITADLNEALRAELGTIAAERGCRAVLLTGAGRGFCAGLDLHGYGDSPGNDGTDEARDRLSNQEHMSRLILAIRALPQPLIAAVNGPAAGFGLALALGCDIRYASDSAVFRAAFINIGVSNCDMGTSWLLPRLIGASRAWELMLTGRIVDAGEADRIGLVLRVVPDEELLEAALETAGHIAANSPWGIRMTKEVMWSQLEIGSLQAGIDLENRTQVLSSMTADMQEAVSAFLEKRPPHFGT